MASDVKFNITKVSSKPTSNISQGTAYVVNPSNTNEADLYIGKDSSTLIQVGATVEQGAKADTSVQSVKVGSTSYSPSSGVVSLPAYPTTLPASDVYAWAKAANKPSYNLDEVPDGSSRKLANYLPLIGGTMSLAHSDSLKIKAAASSNNGAYIAYYSNDQSTNYWRAGMSPNGNFIFRYNDNVRADIDPSGNIYENGTSLITKYAQNSVVIPTYRVPRSNLGNPTVYETGIIDSEFTNKLMTYGPSYIKIYRSSDGSTLTEATEYGDDVKKALVVGDGLTDLTVTVDNYLVIEIQSRDYVYLNMFYAYNSTSGTRFQYKIEKSVDETTWTTEVDYGDDQSTWPGHTVIRHGTIAFHPNAVAGSHHKYVRVWIKCIKVSDSYTTGHIYKIQWWGGYPYGKRAYYTVDSNQNHTFPAGVSATSFTENGTALSSKYLALTGGTLSLANADSLKIKRTAAGSGAFITYYNNNQNTNYWFAGMDTSNAFKFQYSDGATKAQIDPSGIATLFTNSAYGLTIKRLDANAGAFTTYYNNNQSTNFWRSGMASDSSYIFTNYVKSEVLKIATSGNLTTKGTNISFAGTNSTTTMITFLDNTVNNYGNGVAIGGGGIVVVGAGESFRLNYGAVDNENLYLAADSAIHFYSNADAGLTSAKHMIFDTSGNLYISGNFYENGNTALSSKYSQLSAANTFTGNNTFNGAFSATDGATLSADNGDDILSVSPSGIDLNSKHGVNIYASERGYASASEPIRYDSGVVPSDGQDLVNKSYVDGKFVDKSTNQTGIAGNKTWTGNQTVTGSVTQTIGSAAQADTSYYDAQYSYNSNTASLSVRRSSSSDSVTASVNRSVGSSGYDYTTANLYISGGYTTSTSTLSSPRINYQITSEGQTSSSGQYVNYIGAVTLYSGASNSSKYFSVGHEIDASETQHNLKYDAEGRLSLDYDYMWGEETAHVEFKPMNGDFYLGDPNTYGIASIQSIVQAASTCFRGDTSYITMADGSKKLIKDVKVGDIVKGYDVNKKEYTEAVVLQNIKTGEERAFDCYVMDDGTTVDIFNNDGFICNVGTRKLLPHRDADGDYINIYSMKTLLSFHEKTDDQRRIIKEDGNLENTTCVIHKFTADCAHRTARYSLYTSNGTFFVNGLLHGLSSRSLPQYFKTFKINIPDYIDSIFDSVLSSLAQRDESLPDTHIENPDKVADLATLNKAKATIAWAKDKLSKTDYKAMKYAEGALSEEEWLPIKEQRVEYRRIVNDNELIVTEYTEKVAKDNPAVLDEIEVPEHIIRHDKWIKHQKIYDDNYELFKKWALSRKEEQQKRIEESKERSRLKIDENNARKETRKDTK